MQISFKNDGPTRSRVFICEIYANKVHDKGDGGVLFAESAPFRTYGQHGIRLGAENTNKKQVISIIAGIELFCDAIWKSSLLLMEG